MKDKDFVSGPGRVASPVQAFVVPALRKLREGLGTHSIVDANEFQSLGYPSVKVF
jgi:hypothetical protein